MYLLFVLFFQFILGGVYAVDNTIILQRIWKFPGTKNATSFVVESSDRAIGVLYQNLTSGQSSNISTYSGPRLNKLARPDQYQIDQLDSLTSSNSGFYAVQGTAIHKYPFYFQNDFAQPYKKGKVIAIDEQRIAVSVYNNISYCPNIVFLSAFDTEVKYIELQKNTGQCVENNPGMLEDLKNGMFAFSTRYTLYIINKVNLQVVQKLNLSQSQQTVQSVIQYSEILGMSTFFYQRQNKSIILLQVGNSADYQKYVLQSNHTLYQRKDDFYHPAIRPQFVDEKTIVSFYNDSVILGEGFENIMVKNNYTVRANPFQNVMRLATSHKSELMAGFNFQTNRIIKYVFDPLKKNFNVSQNISLPSEGHCIKRGQFTQNDEQLILQISSCRNETQNNICKLNFNSQKFQCIHGQAKEVKYANLQKDQLQGEQIKTNADSNDDKNHTGFAMFHRVQDIGNSSFVTISWKKDDVYLQVQSRSVTSLIISANLRLNISQADGTLVNTKVLKNTQWKTKFSVMVITNVTTITFNLQLAIQNGVLTIKKLPQQSRDINFYQSVAFKQFIVTLSPLADNANFCRLEFFHYMSLTRINQGEMIYDNCSPMMKNYRLISANDINAEYNQLIIERGYLQNKAYLLDFIKVQNVADVYKIQRRHMFKKSLHYNQSPLQFDAYFILPHQKLLIYYEYLHVTGDSRAVDIYNVENPPLFMLKIQASDSYMFNFSIPTEDLQSHEYQFVYAPKNFSLRNAVQEFYGFVNQKTMRYFSNPTQNLRNIIKDRNPSQYKINISSFSIYSQNQTFPKPSRTRLASTGKHLISTVYGQDNAMLVFTEILGNGKLQIIESHLVQNGTVVTTQITSEGYAFVIQQTKIRLIPYYYLDECKNYGLGQLAKFTSTYSTQMDYLIYSIYANLKTHIYLKYSLFDAQHEEIHFQQQILEKTVSLRLSALGNIILIQTKTAIIKSNNRTGKCFRLNKSDISSPVVDIAIFEVQDAGINPTMDQEIQENSQTQINTQFQETTIVLFEDYLILYDYSFEAFTKFSEIKGTYIQDISQDGRFLAYVEKMQDNTQLVHIIEIHSYAVITYVKNFTLPKTKIKDSDQYFTPNILQVQYSSINNLFIRAQNAPNQAANQKALQEYATYSFPMDQMQQEALYIYTQSSCQGFGTLQQNGECRCKTNANMSEQWKFNDDSRISEGYECKCKQNFIKSQIQSCICPGSFTFLSDSQTCICEDGQVQKNDSGQMICSKRSYWWVYLIVSIVAAILVSGGFWMYKKKKSNKKITPKNQPLIPPIKTHHKIPSKSRSQGVGPSAGSFIDDQSLLSERIKPISNSSSSSNRNKMIKEQPINKIKSEFDRKSQKQSKNVLDLSQSRDQARNSLLSSEQKDNLSDKHKNTKGRNKEKKTQEKSVKNKPKLNKPKLLEEKPEESLQMGNGKWTGKYMDQQSDY